MGMPMSRRPRPAGAPHASLKEVLTRGGLDPRLADVIDELPQRIVPVDSRRPFREIGHLRNEFIFVRSGILAKFKPDGSGRRQIVALRFAGEVILPRNGSASYGIQAVVKSEAAIIRASDFDPVVDSHPDLERFFRSSIQRNESIGYEWLVNCGRRDSTARVAHLLCETAVRAGIEPERSTMFNPFTQQQIADITGQTSVNVNRVLADLERQGLIVRAGREITVNDWPELRRVGSFQTNYLD
jgi:CRP-like cAMP-binding protein